MKNEDGPFDLIGEAPIGLVPVVSTCQTKVLCNLLLSDKVVDAASDNIASKTPRSPMQEIENPMPVEPMALQRTSAASAEEGTR